MTFFSKLLLALTMIAGSAQASTLIFNSANGLGQATVDMTGTLLTITLNDLAVNPVDVTSNLSAFILTFNTTPTSATVFTGSAIERTINSGGSYTEGPQVVPGWAFSNIGAAISLDVLAGANHAGPAHTILGAPGGGGTYSAANGSLKSGPHNPFLDGQATFSMNIANLNTLVVSSAVFQFGTADGSNQSPGNLVNSPEPTTFALLGTVAFAALLGRRRLSRR